MPFTKEELLSSREVAGYGVFSSGRIQGVHQGSQGIQFLGGQIERRHACSGNPVLDQGAQLLNRPGTHPAVARKRWASVRATGIRAMAARATLHECFGPFRQIRWRDWRILCPQPQWTQEDSENYGPRSPILGPPAGSIIG